MSRDVGTFEESKRVQEMIESREAGADSAGPSAILDTPYTGGKTQPTVNSFAKPGMGTMRKKGME